MLSDDSRKAEAGTFVLGIWCVLVHVCVWQRDSQGQAVLGNQDVLWECKLAEGLVYLCERSI